jgi:glycosyltransferase involved in cell wall biosynthesis
LVTDVGGNRAVVGHDLAHRLVPSGDVEAFSAALASAVSDPASVARDGALGRQRVIDAYDRSHMVRAYEALWTRHAK